MKVMVTVMVMVTVTVTVTVTADGGHVNPTGHGHGRRPDGGPRLGRVGPDRTGPLATPNERQSCRPAPTWSPHWPPPPHLRMQRKWAARTIFSRGDSHVPRGKVKAGFTERLIQESAWPAGRAARGGLLPGPESPRCSPSLTGIRVTRRRPALQEFTRF